jgi:hypothetical protein
MEKWIPPERRIKTVEESGAEAGVSTGIFNGKVLAGINIPGGLDRYQSDRAYLDILRSYADSMPGFLEVLRDVTPENLEIYAVTVHGIKGASYQICADEAGKEAEVLEYAAKAGNWEKVKKDNENFIETMEKLLAGLGDFLRQTEKKQERPQVAAPDREVLAKLLAACKDYNITEMEEFLTELEEYSYKSGEDLIVWLRQRINDLDYEAIQVRLEQLR